MAAAFLHERLSKAHIIGAALVITGIVLISWHGLHAEPGSRTWIGDLLFVGSNLLWAGFTVLVRQWRLDALRAIAVVSVLSALVTIPGYLVFIGLPHLLALPVEAVVTQGLLEGGLQGVLGIVGYSHAIRLLGVSRAVLFPASVPGGFDCDRHPDSGRNSGSGTNRRGGAGDGRIAGRDWRFPAHAATAGDMIEA
jgi:drug/metabolite transporter (DMT)-like permease